MRSFGDSSFLCSNSVSGKYYYFINRLMKTVQQLQEEVYQQALNSGFFKGQQAQLRAYVLDLIEKEYGSKTKGFQYQHPLISKIRQYPLTSLCLDLIQQFLESFKFKHTLSVFKKQINRTQSVHRVSLAHAFPREIQNPEAQAVLLSIVNQMFSGQVAPVRKPATDILVPTKLPEVPIRTNNFFPDQPKSINTQSTAKSSSPGAVPPLLQQPTQPISKPLPEEKGSAEAFSSGSSVLPSSSSLLGGMEVSASRGKEGSGELSVEKGEEGKKKGKEEKKKVEKEKPPEGAQDLLGDVMAKFDSVSKPNKEIEKNSVFKAKRAFSQEKEKKVVDQAESGANKIRGASAGKAMSSLMSKFMPQAQQPKNESYIQEELDEFQMSKDSTRRNPLFSSSESGFDKSGFDYSVDSNSIDQYEYSERARKVFKKM